MTVLLLDQDQQVRYLLLPLSSTLYTRARYLLLLISNSRSKMSPYHCTLYVRAKRLPLASSWPPSGLFLILTDVTQDLVLLFARSQKIRVFEHPLLLLLCGVLWGTFGRLVFSTPLSNSCRFLAQLHYCCTKPLGPLESCY